MGEFRQDLSYSVKHSKRIYCLLVSAYTMIHEEEKFILADSLKTMDFRVLLLNRDSPFWRAGAELFIHHRIHKEGVLDIEHYRAQCETAEEKLKTTYHAEIGFYNDGAKWRLYIFDDRAFVSRYFGPPESEFAEARDGPVVAFSPEHPMYHWLYEEFKRLAPTEWKSGLPKTLS